MWFDPQTSSMVGGLGGILGCVVGAWGGLAGIFVRKGKYKRLILSYAIVLLFISIVSLCTGVFALLLKQPFHVWYPMGLFGLTVTSVLLPNFFFIKGIYRKLELKKMTLDDLK